MLSLKIDNQFIALPDETEISIEASNPIFSDAGSKTYLFEIPVESLRYIIGNADEIYGESLYDVLEGKRAEIYIDGVQFFSGVVNLEDNISIEDGKIAVSIAFGSLEFEQMIEEMNCRDVELMDEIEIGWVYDSAKVRYHLADQYKSVLELWTDDHVEYVTHDLEFFFPENYVAVTTPNISVSYPGARFCNIRRAYSIASSAPAENYIKSHEAKEKRVLLKGTTGNEKILSIEYNSMRSAPCFYVLYFLDCLFKKLGFYINDNALLDIEDAKRLSFVNTTCHVRRIGDVQSVTIDEENKPYPGFGRRFGYMEDKSSVFTSDRMVMLRQKAVATSDNFPDVSVVDAIKAIQGIFNVRVISYKNTVSIVSIPNILRSTECVDIQVDVYRAYKVENRALGFRLSYNSEKEDTHYDFDKYSKTETMDQYGKIVSRVSPNDPTVFVDIRNGNAYVTKVSEEAVEDGNEKELSPVLFEVGAFGSVTYGNCENDEYTEEVQLNFLPIINNDINSGEIVDKVGSSGNLEGIDSVLENCYALLVEGVDDLNYTSIKLNTPPVRSFIANNPNWNFKDADDRTAFNRRLDKTDWAAVSYFDYNPEEKADSDFMLGIMRGPGSDSEPETFGQNFDGEGNYRVAYTAANYAFTSDSIDNCNRDFDYNGTAEGVGPDELKGRISLKLRAGKYDKDGNPIKDADGKPIVIQDKDRAERGIYDKFWKEYAYFTVNKKIIHITCSMEIVDIVNLDWTKRYKIGEWTGFIANYSFNVNKDGMSEVELEMYYL